ncbi:protein MMS22-like isoform X1 [Musca domestica]|uniref:Protein MMS22-like n=2 Tax=Musca domestica TaxID=7370 RepID=A0A1I8MZT3_MUSDO|nr:protein MMS22-like isoform X1 [Musca domestica]XP_019893786.1 protein MMS22-like isoform X1 [Musca domestica]
MDFDLFEPDEDDDILSVVNIEPTQIPNDCGGVTETIPEFHCTGEDSMNSQFSSESFVKNVFFQSYSNARNKAIEEATLTKYDFQKANMNSGAVNTYLFGEACMNIQYMLASLQGAVGNQNEQSYYLRRRHVTMLLHIVLQSTHSEQWEFLQPHLCRLRALLNNCVQVDVLKSIYFANSCKGNECNIPAYHLLHGLLEWKFLDLCILQKYDSSNPDNTDGIADDEKKETTCNVLIEQIENIFDILLTCSIYLFAKKRSPELLFTSPFPCTCIKEMWLLMQFAIEKWHLKFPDGETLTFWSTFNKAMQKIKGNMENLGLTPLSYCEFYNWIQYALVRLHGYRSNGQYEGANYTRATNEDAQNYEFCERITQQFLNANPSEEQLRIYIGIQTPILLEWWPPKVNIAMVLWEHFHKKLNSSFFIAGSAPSNLAVACVSGRAYVDKYRNLLSKPPDANLSSYTLFVLLMGKTLQRLLAGHAQHQAQKLLGRIYTKFSAQKFLALNETGIHHLIELFLVLALCGDFNDLSGKLKDKLLSIGLDKITGPKQVAVTKGHMALWILYAEHQYDLTDYITKVLQQLSAIRNDLAVSKIIADSLLDIFDHADTFQRGESLLVGSWIPNFLNNCTPVEQERTLEALHMMFVKIHNCEQHFLEINNDLMRALNTSILPFIKQQYVNSFSHWLPILASDFCAHSFAVTDTQNFQKLFSYFSEQQTSNRYAVTQFVLHVLESERKALVDHTIIMQVWLRSLVLLTANNEDVLKLSKIVVKLSEFAFMTNIKDEDDLLKAKEPLCIFIASVGKTYDATTDHSKRSTIANNFNAYIRNFEKWLNSDLKLEKSEVTFRFYSFIAIVIFNCPSIVYSKSKITCFFHVAFTRYILPTSIQMGKPPEGKLAQLVHKIWPVLVQGIGRLNFKSDPYITKTLSDLIQKWTPHFKISTNARQVARPFINCLQSDNQDISLFVFEKLTALFLSTQRRQADPNACLVITIYQEVVDAISSNNEDDDENAVRRLQTFLKGCSFATLEHIMMVDEIVPSRPLLLELFKRIFNSPVYQKSIALKDLIREHLRLLTKKHLSYYTFFYFELLTKLCSISYEVVEDILPFLMEEIQIVEQKRGAGEDNRIRGCLQKLQQNIRLAKQK